MMITKSEHDAIWEGIQTKVVQYSINHFGLDAAKVISEREAERQGKYLEKTAFRINCTWITEDFDYDDNNPK